MAKRQKQPAPQTEAGPPEFFRRRFAEVVDQLGGPARVHERFGFSRDAVWKWKEGKSRPPLLDVAILCSAAGRSIDWLVGLGVDGEREFSFVPRLDVRASAGGGALAVDESVEEMIAFKSEWLRRLGINPRAARTMFADGDSMEPTIGHGDLLLVDEAIQHVATHGIYVVIYQGMVLVKRIQIRLDGTIVLMSDNTKYKDEVVKPSEAVDLRIGGRVRWFGRTI